MKSATKTHQSAWDVYKRQERALATTPSVNKNPTTQQNLIKTDLFLCTSIPK